MPVPARRIGNTVSHEARKQYARIRAYPTIDTWLNPITRGLARRLANQEWRQTIKEIDFPYRITELDIGSVHCAKYETNMTTQNRKVI